MHRQKSTLPSPSAPSTPIIVPKVVSHGRCRRRPGVMVRTRRLLDAMTPVVVVDFFGDLDHADVVLVPTLFRLLIFGPARVVARRSWFLLPEDGLLRRYS